MTVWLLPGQGAQKPGMGSDLLDVDVIRNTFDVMSDILDLDLINLATNGTEDDVNDAQVAQALTMAVSVGVGLELLKHGIKPDAIVGFSLGQISGLVLSGLLSLEDATRLLKVRSGKMAEAVKSNPGGMVALLGATLADAQSLCDECSEGQVLVCANHNCPGQIVISGENNALDRALAAWTESGKKGVRLATAGAFHSPLMSDAAEAVEEYASTLDFASPKATLICNTDAKPFVIDEAAARLGEQVKSGVMFEQSVRSLIEQGETDFVEVGYGKVLTGLVRKIDKDTSRTNVGTYEELTNYLASMS